MATGARCRRIQRTSSSAARVGGLTAGDAHARHKRVAELRTLPTQEGTDPKAIESYGWSFARLVEWADGYPGLELDRADLEDFVDDRMQAVSRTTVRKNVVDLKSSHAQRGCCLLSVASATARVWWSAGRR
jgi:hypothetical protein